jgi:hypothetical protein
MISVNLRFSEYEFSLPFGSYVETCTSFYVFSGPKWLSSRVEYLDTY